MNVERYLERISAVARDEPTPTIDVSGDVLDRLRHGTRAVNVPMTVMAGTSAVAAAIVLAYALDNCFAFYDPFIEWLCSMNMVLQ